MQSSSKPAGNTVVRAGIGYTVGNILIKGINFLTLPLFSRLMTTAEFGVYNVFLSCDGILLVVLSLALATSVRSAHYEFHRTDEYVSSVSLVFILNALILAVIILAGGTWLLPLIGLDKTVLLLLIPFSFGGAVIQLYNEKLSLDYEYKKYLLVALADSVSNVAVSLLLICTVFRGRADLGRIVATSGSIFLLASFILCRIWRKAPPRYDRTFWRFGLHYSLPIVPHGLSQILLAQFDRIMISRLVSDSAAGIYSLAGNLLIVVTVITASVGTAWTTWFYARMDKGDHREIQKYALLLAGLFAFLVIGLMALSPELIALLGGEDYMEGRFVAVPMLLSGFLIFLYNVIIPGEYYMKKTRFIMAGTLVAVVIDLVTNYVFIKAYGYIAAAYTTLFAYVCYLLLHLFLSRRLIGFDVVKLKGLLGVTLPVVLTGVLSLLFTDRPVFRLGAGILLAAVLALPLYRKYGSLLQAFLHRDRAGSAE